MLEYAQDMYDRLKAGETLHVRANHSGKVFYVRPEYQKLGTVRCLAGCSLLDEKKKVIPGKRRKVMEKEDFMEWFHFLEEVP